VAYVDLNTIHNPATGTVAPAAWGDQVRDNFEFLINPPACSVSSNDDQVFLANDTTTVVPAPNESFDNDGMHSTVSNTSRITIQTAGRYLFMATARFDSNGSGGMRRVSLLVNGTSSYGGMQIIGAANDPVRIQATRALVLSAGEYVETTAWQNSGSGLIGVTLDEFFVKYITR
jgi:hypothetical protein